MATTHIHAIKSTLSAAVEYVLSDKVEDFDGREIPPEIMHSIDNGEVTFYTLTGYHKCTAVDPAADFAQMAVAFGGDEVKYGNSKTKDGKPVFAWHLIQSFDGCEVTPQQANAIGIKLVEELFSNHPALISTHTNTENIHNHIMFCAWSFDGKKHNNDNAMYQKIRSVSDRLCEEAGLRVLEGTRKVNLVKWEDELGKTHYFEPTDRKIRLIEDREAGMASPDDVGSYRNTLAYDAKWMKEQTHIEAVKEAIDQALPYATSYEHLLRMLREAGLEIRAKKKNGEWLKHISFTPYGAERGVRDTSIDKEGGYYCRENLTKVIEENNRERKEARLPFRLATERTPPYYAEYRYGETDIEQLDPYYRTVRYENRFESGYRVIERSEAERLYVKDIKYDHSDLIGYDRQALETVARLAEQNEKWQRGGLSPEYKAKMEAQLQAKLDELYFVEQKGISSLTALRAETSALWQQHDEMVKMLGQIDAAIKLCDTVDGEAAGRMDKLKADRAALDAKMQIFSKDLSMYDRCLRSLERITGEERQREKDRVIHTVSAKQAVPEQKKPKKREKDISD